MVLPAMTKKLNHAAHGEALDTITTGLRSRFSFSSTPDNASQRGEGISDSLDHIGEVILGNVSWSRARDIVDSKNDTITIHGLEMLKDVHFH